MRTIAKRTVKVVALAALISIESLLAVTATPLVVLVDVMELVGMWLWDKEIDLKNW